MFGDIGVPELLIILVIIILVFGANRVAEIGGALGKSVREFRRAVEGHDEAKVSENKSESKAVEAPPQQSQRSP
jgi:sec-independent protein translocase protein TatA